MTMLRKIVLSLLMLFSVAATLPLTALVVDWSADAAASQEREGKRRVSRSYRKKRRAWWRRRQALLRKRRAALLARKRRLARARAAQLARARTLPRPIVSNVAMTTLPTLDFPLPVRWTSAPAVGNQMRYVVRAPSGTVMGTVAVSSVQPRMPSDLVLSLSARRKSLGDVPFVALRRLVIERMIEEGGWVANDWEQEIGGRRVYVVLAQSGNGSSPAVAKQFWNFYFVEVNGRIYSLTVNGPVEFANPLAFEAEQALASLRAPAPRTLTARTLE